MEQEFTEFSEFRESDKSLKHELGSFPRSCLSPVSFWCCGSMLVSYTKGCRFEPFYCNDKYFLLLSSENSVKTFREKSIVPLFWKYYERCNLQKLAKVNVVEIFLPLGCSLHLRSLRGLFSSNGSFALSPHKKLKLCWGFNSRCYR